MRNLLLGGLAVLAGCGINQEKFAEDFVEMYCTAYEDCDTSGRACPVTLDDQPTASDCEFDKTAAKECLATDYGCDDTIAGFEVVTTPDSCLTVCGQDVTEE